MLLAAATACLIASEKPMVQMELFFGREIEGRGSVTKSEWADFSEKVIAKNFPDGFTVSDGEGTWRDPQSKAAVHEESKIVVIVVPRTADLKTRLAQVIDAYRARFHQQSVGLVTREVCAAF